MRRISPLVGRGGLQVVLPFLLILVAEVFFFQGDSRPTLLFHGLNVLVCVFLPLLVSLDHGLFQAFALVSVLRILNVGMPVFLPLTLYWLPLVYGPLIPAAYFVLKDGDNVFSGVGRRWKHYYLPVGILVGLVLGGVEYWLQGSECLVPGFSPLNLFFLAVVMLCFVGLVEELVFRAILQGRLVERLGAGPGVFLASLVFALMHSGYSSIPYLFFVFLVGGLLGVVYRETGSLAFVAIIHGSLNFFLFSILPVTF